ncbi:uncharacterized protein LOC141614191 [Silene latifolia]|uniref:uncharacterized protein LOC141614191 n=1 Tax=Silene latifolia TaxID=37657 RepID=UPI003D78774D
MKLNPSKCTFGVSSSKFLGYIVTQREIEASNEQIKAVLQLESPEKLKGVQRLADHEQAFRELKHYLSSPPLLSKPGPGEPLFLYLAVTEVAVSVILVRDQEKEQKPVYYVSKSLLPAETRYTSLEKLVLALAECRSGLCTLADEEILTLEGNGEPEVWQMHIDGASNQKGEGVGLILRSPQGDLIAQAVRCEFKATNNETEYEALILGMQLALEIGIPRDQNVEAYVLATLGAKFKPTELSSIPIAHMLEPSIQKTDEVDKGELEDDPDEVGVQTATKAGEGSQPVDQPPDKPSAQADNWDWRTPYLDSLRHNNMSDDKKEVRAFRIKASRFILIDDILLKKSLAGPYLWCLDKKEAQTVLHALHSGECGNHVGGRSLANKALRQGYFWSTMKADAAEYARKCDDCQRSAPIIHQPAKNIDAGDDRLFLQVDRGRSIHKSKRQVSHFFHKTKYHLQV